MSECIEFTSRYTGKRVALDYYAILGVEEQTDGAIVNIAVCSELYGIKVSETYEDEEVF